MKSQGCRRQLSRWGGIVILWASVALFSTTLPSIARAQSIPGIPGLRLTSFNDSAGEHLIFVGNDSHVHQLSCPAPSNCNSPASWSNQDLTTLTGANVSSTGVLTNFHDANGAHVFFIDSNSRLNQLSSSDGALWRSAELSVPDFCCGLSGYSANGQGTDASLLYARLFYQTIDFHIHMSVSVNGGPWGDSDLTHIAGGTPAGGTSFSSFHDSSGEHVFYVGTDSHLYQLYGYWTTETYYICNPFTKWCGPVSMTRLNWTNQDLKLSSNGPLVGGTFSWGLLGGPGGTLVNSSLSSLSDIYGEHVFYIASDREVHELNYDGGSSWVDQNVTITSRAILPLSPGNASLASSSDALGLKLFFIGTDSNVHEVSPGSTDADLTTLAGGPMVYSYCGMSVLSFEPNGRQVESDVFYLAPDGSLHRLSQVGTAWFLNPGWYWTISNWFDTELISSI